MALICKFQTAAVSRCFTLPIEYETSLLAEMVRMACTALPESGVEMKDKASQIPLIIDFYLLSKCNCQIFFQVLSDMETERIDLMVEITIRFLLNNFAAYFFCPFIPMNGFEYIT